jgi:hypothetical protein
MPGADKPIQRLGDGNSAGGGNIANIPQDGTVFANNVKVAVDGSKGTEDGHVDYRRTNVHAENHWSTAGGSSNVFVNSKPVNYTDNVDTCGDVRVGGSGDVFVGDSVDQDTPANRALNGGDDHAATGSPAAADETIRTAIASGAVSRAEIEVGNRPVVTATDTKPPATSTRPTSSDCSDIHSLFDSGDPDNPVTPPSGDQIDNIQLTPNWTVGTLTRKPYIVFDHPLRGDNNGISLENLICNLKLLALNVIDPIKAQYGNAFVTNTFREGTGTSQHGKCQAVDLQFKGIKPSEYFTIAQWIKDNITYDQLLLEYKTTGSCLPWIHVSYANGSNRKQVLTLMNDKTYAQGLSDLSQTNA